MKYLSIFFILVLALTFVSAWPYQLNISNGQIIDLNASNNATTNFTIYVYMINQTYNNTIYINQTNFTCYNCTNISYYNYTYIFKNGTFYNITEADSKFVTLSDYNSYKAINFPTRAEYDTLLSRVNSINLTATPTDTSHGIMWGGIIIGWLLTGIAIYFIAKSNGGSYETI